MKKYFIYSLVVSCLIAIVFTFGALLPVTTASAQSMTVSQLVELLITIGAIAPDKAVAARAAVAGLSTVAVSAPATIVATSSAYIQVLSPNGGERWEIDLDLPYSITWGSSGLTQVRVALVSTTKSIGTCELTPTPLASKNGNHEYRVLLKTAKCYNLVTGASTPLKDSSYKALVYYTDALGHTIKDESNSAFRINPVLIPSLTVTYPNGAENLVRNDEYTIKYSLKNEDDSTDGLIYYYLLDNNGYIAHNGHKSLRNGTFDLEIPSNISAGAYKLKLKLTTDDDRIELEDTSNNFFWISTGL